MVCHKATIQVDDGKEGIIEDLCPSCRPGAVRHSDGVGHQQVHEQASHGVNRNGQINNIIFFPYRQGVI